MEVKKPKQPIALHVDNLEKTYGTGTQALKGIDLDIPQGSFFGLLGPNGAGKSTLIHCIMGLAIPTGGKAEVFGHDVVGDYRAARASVGLAPQEVNLDWFLTVEETLDYHGGYYGMPKKDRKERIDELLDAFSLTDKRDVNSRFLSGGMKRRVVLARALMHRPKMLILDEPTAGVDVELRLELWQYMTRVNKEDKTTILLTTHYIEEAEQLCDNLALINGGKIIKTGTSDELKKHYKKNTLEDVYLELVGRGELTRSSLNGADKAEIS
jgi:ABC-2 type transport system ATP-binding protein